VGSGAGAILAFDLFSKPVRLSPNLSPERRISKQTEREIAGIDSPDESQCKYLFQKDGLINALWIRESIDQRPRPRFARG
jgi:hypothetical protein